jgi:hypothetical protein
LKANAPEKAGAACRCNVLTDAWTAAMAKEPLRPQIKMVGGCEKSGVLLRCCLLLLAACYVQLRN